MAEEGRSDGVESLPDWPNDSPVALEVEPRGDAALEGPGADWCPELAGGWRVGGEEEAGGSGDFPAHFGVRQGSLFVLFLPFSGQLKIRFFIIIN